MSIKEKPNGKGINYPKTSDRQLRPVKNTSKRQMVLVPVAVILVCGLLGFLLAGIRKNAKENTFILSPTSGPVSTSPVEKLMNNLSTSAAYDQGEIVFEFFIDFNNNGIKNNSEALQFETMLTIDSKGESKNYFTLESDNGIFTVSSLPAGEYTARLRPSYNSGGTPTTENSPIRIYKSSAGYYSSNYIPEKYEIKVDFLYPSKQSKISIPLTEYTPENLVLRVGNVFDTKRISIEDYKMGIKVVDIANNENPLKYWYDGSKGKIHFVKGEYIYIYDLKKPFEYPQRKIRPSEPLVGNSIFEIGKDTFLYLTSSSNGYFFKVVGADQSELPVKYGSRHLKSYTEHIRDRFSIKDDKFLIPGFVEKQTGDESGYFLGNVNSPEKVWRLTSNNIRPAYLLDNSKILMIRDNNDPGTIYDEDGKTVKEITEWYSFIYDLNTNEIYGVSSKEFTKAWISPSGNTALHEIYNNGLYINDVDKLKEKRGHKIDIPDRYTYSTSSSISWKGDNLILYLYVPEKECKGECKDRYLVLEIDSGGNIKQSTKENNYFSIIGIYEN